MALGHTFVVKHDWASAFAKAQDFAGGEIRLPYDECVFEFRLSGRTVILWVKDLQGSQTFSTFIDMPRGWYTLSAAAQNEPFVQFLWEQVRAICVALEAEVAVDNVQRASPALNEKRQRTGKPQLADFHIVDLAHRYRRSCHTSDISDRHVRLHFRRGHWRHYEEHRTWIRWCLVGNPDLGFVNKHYAL